MPTARYPDEPGILDESELPTVYVRGVMRKTMTVAEAENWAKSRANACQHKFDQACRSCETDALVLEAAISCGGVVISPLV